MEESNSENDEVDVETVSDEDVDIETISDEERMQATFRRIYNLTECSVVIDRLPSSTEEESSSDSDGSGLSRVWGRESVGFSGSNRAEDTDGNNGNESDALINVEDDTSETLSDISSNMDDFMDYGRVEEEEIDVEGVYEEEGHNSSSESSWVDVEGYARLLESDSGEDADWSEDDEQSPESTEVPDDGRGVGNEGEIVLDGLNANEVTRSAHYRVPSVLDIENLERNESTSVEQTTETVWQVNENHEASTFLQYLCGQNENPNGTSVVVSEGFCRITGMSEFNQGSSDSESSCSFSEIDDNADEYILNRLEYKSSLLKDNDREVRTFRKKNEGS